MPGLNPTQEDVDNFVAITAATPADATRFLSNGVSLEGAIEDYYAAQEAGDYGEHADEEDELDAALAESAADAAPGGARTLSGAPAEALPEGWGRRGPARVGRIGQWGGGEDDDEDEDEAARRRGNELYTGGERSGLAVQNPDQRGGRGLVDDILNQARQAGPPAEEPQQQAAAANPWGGVGHTLGSDETPSVQVGAGAASRAPRQRVPGAFADEDDDEDEEDDDEAGAEVARRRVTFWRDGFSIEDGELYRYDEPGNRELLEAIHAGRAPLSLFNVRFGQRIELLVDQRTNEDYTPPPKGPLKAFSGGGNRLGSPAPAAASSSSAPASAPAPAAAAPAREFKVDDAKPTTSIQIRLGDGTRLVARVNLDHTVADLRAFVAASRPDPRAFVLQTTFPSRELPDGETVEQAKLQNAVVVQRFV
ncbi:UBX domain-containing protein 3 [Vanrija pseudolonga]|uniref:UBX domain-containing protein 3 n=1 Tax=Vanrija pseudolonga TaxID=143232 RepID=A0AAF0YCR2_9TREE|nr:UBX domain-containing protein 3 [Vanrija pseudolonga]